MKDMSWQKQLVNSRIITKKGDKNLYKERIKTIINWTTDHLTSLKLNLSQALCTFWYDAIWNIQCNPRSLGVPQWSSSFLAGQSGVEQSPLSISDESRPELWRLGRAWATLLEDHFRATIFLNKDLCCFHNWAVRLLSSATTELFSPNKVSFSITP